MVGDRLDTVGVRPVNVFWTGFGSDLAWLGLDWAPITQLCPNRWLGGDSYVIGKQFRVNDLVDEWLG